MGAVALPGAKAWRSRDLRLGSDRHGELIERDGQPPVRQLLDRQLVMPPSNVLDEGMADTITLALRSCLRPRIGRSRDFRRLWSPSMRLLAYCSVRCHAAGSSSSSTAGVGCQKSVVAVTSRFRLTEGYDASSLARLP